MANHLLRVGIVSVCCWLGATSARADILIDSFDTTQTVTVSGGPPGPKSTFGSSSAAEAIGGERDILVNRTSSGSGSLTVDVGISMPGMAAQGAGFGVAGNSVFTWDGPDSAAAVNATGLGGIDLTGGGLGTQFLLDAASDLGVTLLLRVFTDSTRFSELSAVVPPDPEFDLSTFAFPFSAFNPTGPGGGANFTNVGAIQLQISGGSSADAIVDVLSIPTVAVPAPPSALLLGLGAITFVTTYGWRLRRRAQS